jgi:hypothetical protein
MKIKFLILSVLVFATIFSACSKKSASLTNTQLLTQHTWQIQSALIQEGNSQTSYTKGGVNSTGSDYSIDRFTFKAGGTGVFVDNLDSTWTFTWAFATGDETKMTITINYATPETLSWAFIFLTQNTFTYTEYFENGGTEILAEMQLIPA